MKLRVSSVPQAMTSSFIKPWSSKVLLFVVLTLIVSAGARPVRAVNDTYFDAMVNIGTTLGDDGLYYFNLMTLIRSAATPQVKQELGRTVPPTLWMRIQQLPIARSYRQMSPADKNTLKAILADLRDAVVPEVKVILAAAATIETWLGVQTTGIDAFFALDDDNPERRYDVETLHKTCEVFLKTTPPMAFADALRRPKFAANLLKYHAK